MALTSLGGVSNSGARAFTNPLGEIAIVNYGRVVGSDPSYGGSSVSSGRYPSYNNYSKKWKKSGCSCGCK